MWKAGNEKALGHLKWLNAEQVNIAGVESGKKKQEEERKSRRLGVTTSTAGCALVRDDEGAHVGCQSGLRPRDTPLGLILFLVSTYLPIP